MSIFRKNFLVLFFLFLMIPVAIRVSGGAKPIDFVFIDIAIALSVPVFFLVFFVNGISKSSAQVFFVLGLLLFSFLTSLFFGIVNTGSIVPLLSFIKLFKVTLAVFLGFSFARYLETRDFLYFGGLASVVFSLLMIVSQLLIDGSLAPRWGDNFLGFPTYGFPNMPASFFIIPIAFLLASYFLRRRLIYIFLAFSLSAFMILSLSRSALVVLVIFLLLTTLFIFKFKDILFFGLAALVMGMCALYALPESAWEIFNHRVDRVFTGADPTSGRTDIWKETWMLVLERPWWGYGFESFSIYHQGHDTPHNQYLEILYKAGFVGLILFSSFVLYLYVNAANYIKYHIDPREMMAARSLLFALVAILIGSMTQPNLTYSLTGSWFFFILSFFSFKLMNVQNMKQVCEV